MVVRLTARGFTLLEMAVALAIFSIIVVAGSTVVSDSVSFLRRSGAAADSEVNLQLALDRIGRAIRGTPVISGTPRLTYVSSSVECASLKVESLDTDDLVIKKVGSQLLLSNSSCPSTGGNLLLRDVIGFSVVPCATPACAYPLAWNNLIGVRYVTVNLTVETDGKTMQRTMDFAIRGI